MAGILKYSSAHSNNCNISFIVVGPGDLCKRVSEGLHEAAKNKRVLAVHQCESIRQVVNPGITLGIDFIVFAFDWRVSQSLSEVETNIKLIDDHYIISGCACLVNCTGIPNVMGLTSHKARQIRDKYNIRFISANTKTPVGCISLGERLLNIAEAKLGLISGIPGVPFFLQYN